MQRTLALRPIRRDDARMRPVSRSISDNACVSLARRHVLVGAPALWLAGVQASAQPQAQALPLQNVHDELWFDATRQRELPIRLRWPPARPSGTSWPLVLFSHGLGGSIDAGAVFAQCWADAGVAVLHMQHPGSDIRVARQGVSALRAAASPAQLVARARDVRFVIDEIVRRHSAGTGPWPQVRLDAIGMGGHSFGSHTVFAVAGQHYPGDITLIDTRIQSFAALSPSLPPGDARSALRDLTRPMLCLTGTLDGEVLANGATPERRAAVYDFVPAKHKAGLVLDGADHMTFAGQTGPRFENFMTRPAVAREQQARHHSILCALTTHWWRAHLLQDASARQRLVEPEGLGAADRWQIS